MTVTLVLGGTRSGKSARAEELATATGLPVAYVATADGSDPSLVERIAAHVARRPATWTTIEAGDDLAAAVAEAAEQTTGARSRALVGTAVMHDADSSRRCVVVDGLGPWIATALHRAGAFDDPSDELLSAVRERVDEAVERLARAAGDLSAAGGAAIIVAEQSGEGVLPADRASRLWLDLLGSATQHLAADADRVELVVAGRSIALAQGAPRTAQDAPDDLAALRTHGDTAVRPGDADHAVNVRAEGPPAWLRQTLETALAEQVTRYPDERDACAALAALHRRDPREIVPANGAAQALWLLPAALRPRLAACVHPGFTESEAALRAHGVDVVRVLRDPDANFALDPTAVPEQADLVIVGNPASPSGTLDPAAALLALRRPGRTVVVDEAFIDLVPGEPGSLVRDRLDDVIVVRSLTKSLAIPGLRAGYAVAPAPLAERLRAVRPPWSVNALALAALTAVARRPELLADAAERTAAEQRDLAARLGSLAGVRTWPAAANYALIEVADGAAVAAALRRRRFAVREAASFPGLDGRHLRVTARDPEQNARFVAALAESLAEVAGEGR